ncbi:MAG TPA: CPBP family intramembrane glutamic endopeptidase [Nitrososphaera sp.]|nr:CPBP family intramembrane glutamic endopeptidase [Nitrososphaera sp.]
MAGNFADEKADMNPKAWLSRYRRTSVGYLTKMLLFYHGIGIGLLLLGNAIIDQILPEHEEPGIPRSLSGVLAAGPLEETVFFGIPYYVFGNAYSVLVTGGLWVGIHLFNTDTISINSLAFGNLLFVLPSLFFSLRTWVSGKGWFSIITHSAWNGVFFTAGCSAGEFECTLIDPDIWTNVLTIGLSVALLVGTYVLYKNRETDKTWQQQSNEFNI